MRFSFGRTTDPDTAPTPIELRFERDVERSFSPPPEVVARTRESLVSEFRAATLQPRPVAAWRSRAPARRFTASLLAVGLLAGSVGLVSAQSGPGQPFYGLRLAIETVSLPPRGTQARIDAEAARLTARFTEAESAAWAGDPGGLVAALDAYTAGLRDLRSEIGSVSGADPQLGAALTGQTAWLLTLAEDPTDGVGVAARAALEENTVVRGAVGPNPGASQPDVGGTNASGQNGGSATSFAPPTPTPPGQNGGSTSSPTPAGQNGGSTSTSAPATSAPTPAPADQNGGSTSTSAPATSAPTP
ncbi:MAG: hypothetical protein IVW53_14505, partial [Chloroflexi bacterium]|nr:hypothetical protein [Chloroflexota bacterium]